MQVNQLNKGSARLAEKIGQLPQEKIVPAVMTQTHIGHARSRPRFGKDPPKRARAAV